MSAEQYDAGMARIKARVRVRAAWIVAGALAFLAFVAFGMFALGTLWRGYERDAQQSAIVSVVAHTAKATDNNAAMIFAVCRAFNRRDRVSAYYDAKIDALRHEYGTTTFLHHAEPIYDEQKIVEQKLVSTDCTSLMNRAIIDSSLPKNRRPTPIPLASDLHF
jgi:hypothetical protein